MDTTFKKGTREYEEEIRMGHLYTNLAYVMADTAESFARQAMARLQRVGQTFNTRRSATGRWSARNCGSSMAISARWPSMAISRSTMETMRTIATTSMNWVCCSAIGLRATWRCSTILRRRFRRSSRLV